MVIGSASSATTGRARRRCCVLAGVYEPTFGTMSMEGRLSSFTDITLGMDPEATGLENIIFRSRFPWASPSRRPGGFHLPSRNFPSSVSSFRLPVRHLFKRDVSAASLRHLHLDRTRHRRHGRDDFRRRRAFHGEGKARLTNLLGALDEDPWSYRHPRRRDHQQSLCNKVVWLDHGEVRRGRFI